jgi:hypothetical protein
MAAGVDALKQERYAATGWVEAPAIVADGEPYERAARSMTTISLSEFDTGITAGFRIGLLARKGPWCLVGSRCAGAPLGHDTQPIRSLTTVDLVRDSWLDESRAEVRT